MSACHFPCFRQIIFRLRSDGLKCKIFGWMCISYYYLCSETLLVLGVGRVGRVYQLQVFKLSPADSYCSNTRQLLSCPPSPQLPLSLLYLLLHASLQPQSTLSTTSQSPQLSCPHTHCYSNFCYSPRLLLY